MAQLHKDAIMLDGRIALFPLNGKREHRIEAVLDGKAYPCEAIDDRRPLKALGETVLTYAGFRVTLPLEPKSGRHTLWFVMHTDGVTVRPRAFSFGSFAPIGREYTSAYYLKNGWRLTLDNERLLIDAQTPGMRRRANARSCASFGRRTATARARRCWHGGSFPFSAFSAAVRCG